MNKPIAVGEKMNTTKEQRAPLIEEGLIVLLCGGTLTDVCRNLDISKSTWYRWKHEYNHGKIELSDNSERFCWLLSKIRDQKSFHTARELCRGHPTATP